MSESQKMVASLSGAFLAHFALVFLVVAIPRTPSAGSSSSRGERDQAPRQVSVMMGELMERLERERKEKETAEAAPEPALPRPAGRTLIGTDLNRPEDLAPENARFESDRNTTAASRLRPDPLKPSEDSPTLEGDSPLPHRVLASRDYRPGDLDRSGAAAAASTAASSASLASLDSSISAADAAPTLGQTTSAALREKRFADPDSSASAVEPAKVEDAESPEPLKSTDEESAKAERISNPAVPEETSALTVPPTTATATAEAAPGFSPTERVGAVNGSVVKEGDAAVDAVGTPMGRYTKSVRDLISERWHRYRQDHADSVTWGILKLKFTVEPSGRIRDIEITKNEANAMLADFSLKAIQETELPPMPEEVARLVGSRGLVIQYDIIIY